MTINLPDDLERFIRAEVQSGHFASEDEAIVEAVRLLRQQLSQAARPTPPAGQRAAATTTDPVLGAMRDAADDLDGIVAEAMKHRAQSTLVRAETTSPPTSAKGASSSSPAKEELPATKSDEEVLADTECQLPLAEDRRLSELLDRQQAGVLTKEERRELKQLMRSYEEGLLRKARALAEAVRRGLRQPFEP